MIKNSKKTKKPALETAVVKTEPAKAVAAPQPPAQPPPVKPAPVPVATTTPVRPPAPAPARTPAATPAPPKTNQVCLELVKADAKQVAVAGSFNEWQPEKTPLHPAGNGRWVGNLVVHPGRHEYLFVVDGQWLPDPNAKESVANPFGGQNSVLLVSA